MPTATPAPTPTGTVGGATGRPEVTPPPTDGSVLARQGVGAGFIDLVGLVTLVVIGAAYAGYFARPKRQPQRPRR